MKFVALFAACAVLQLLLLLPGEAPWPRDERSREFEAWRVRQDARRGFSASEAEAWQDRYQAAWVEWIRERGYTPESWNKWSGPFPRFEELERRADGR